MALVSGELCVIHFTISHMNVILLEITPICILITPSGLGNDTSYFLDLLAGDSNWLRTEFVICDGIASLLCISCHARGS